MSKIICSATSFWVISAFPVAFESQRAYLNFGDLLEKSLFSCIVDL